MASEMRIEIPSQLISDTIRAEIVRQIGGENKEKLIEAVVKTAMTGKKDNYRDTPTYFEETVNNTIREEAMKVFREWLENNRTQIRDALFKYLNGNKQKRLTEFCENLSKNIRSYGINVNLQFHEKN